MLMTHLIPRFRDFCAKEIHDNGFDYIVPIETKGMVLLEEALPTSLRGDSHILFRRAFDFISPQEAADKTAALVDDTLVIGRTLNRSEDDLRSKGIGQVRKYAFILYDDPKYQKFRRVQDIKCCSILSPLEYSLILEELSELSMRDRPSYPDHIVYFVQLHDTYPTEAIISLCRETGTLVEYDDNDSARICSIHYPAFTPRLPKYADDTGPNKLRMSIHYQGNQLTFSPGFFPCLNASEPDMSDTLWRQFYELLDRPWHSKSTRLTNVYESFTMAMRVRMARNFLSFLEKAGVKYSVLDVRKDRFKRFYGDELGDHLVKIILKETTNVTSAQEASFNDIVVADNAEHPDMYTLTRVMLSQLDDVYQQTNRNEPDRFQWRSQGLNIEELSRRTNYSKLDVSIGAELLNNYGYATPAFQTVECEDGNVLQRTYRSTEIGTLRLRS